MVLEILKASLIYRGIDKTLTWVLIQLKESALARLVLWFVHLWARAVDESQVVRAVMRPVRTFRGAASNSTILRRFLKEDETGRFAEGGLAYRALCWKIRMLRRLYQKLALARLLEGSIFAKPWIWAILIMGVTPLIPTMAVLALVLVAACSLLLCLVQNEGTNLRYFAVNKYVWFYMLIYGLATLTSVDFRGSLPVGLITIAFLLFYHILVSAIRSKTEVLTLLAVVAGAGALVGAYGILQFMNPSTFASAWLDNNMFDFSMRVYSTLANPNVLGTYFLLAIPLAGAGLLLAREHMLRLYFTLALGLMVICLVLTYSRGAYLGILFAAAVFFVLLNPRFIVPGLVALLILFLMLPTAILHRFFSIGNLADTSTSFRVFIWMGTISMLRDYWFSGVGPGEAAWALVYPAYSLSGIVTPHSHNLLLQITSDAGAPALFIFLCVMYQYFKASTATLAKGLRGDGRILVIATLSAVIGFLVQAMTDYTFYNYRVMLFFWAVLGVGVLATKYQNLEDTPKLEHEVKQ